MKKKFAPCAGQALAIALAVLVSWLLKRHYSHASPEGLRWILTPTAWLSSFALQTELVFCPGEGYLSREHAILISPACAGVNFLIVALLSLVFGFGRHFTTPGRALGWLSLSLAMAWLTTLLVNTTRIVVSVRGAHLAARLSGLTFHSVHRLLGIGIYLAGLLALCWLIQLWLSSRGAQPSRSSAWLVALGCYAGMTLVVPLLRGAAHNPEYWSHAAPVSVAVGGAIALLFAAGGRSWKNGRHAVRSPECSRSPERSERITTELGAG